LAWAMSVHRMQGSSYKAIVAATCSSSHYAMLTRGLQYTAITRAEELCVMVGETKALSMAVAKPEMRKRNSTLAARIKDPSMSGELF